MNIDYIESFENIKKYPLHQMTELISTKEDSYLLFQYGPYLVMHFPIERLKKFIFEKLNPFQNNKFRLLCELAYLIRISESKDKIGKVKSDILEIKKLQYQFGYQYSDLVCNIADELIQSIRTYQKENKCLESAMLNYAPIVPYMGTLRYPENSYEVLSYAKDSSMDNITEKISMYFEKYIIDILKHNDEFIIVDNTMKEKEKWSHITIPNQLINLANSDYKGVSIYFMLVYVKYIMKENYSSEIESIFKINSSYNKLFNGGLINVHEAMEKLMSVTLPSEFI